MKHLGALFLLFIPVLLAAQGGETKPTASALRDPKDDSLVGRPAPDFELTDGSGQKHRLGDYRGQAVFMHIGATWCGGCQQEAAWIEELAEKYSPKGVRFFHLVQGENEYVSLDYKKHYRSTGTELLDFDFSVARGKYNARSWPTTVVIGPDGTIRYHAKMASRNPSDVEKVLSELTSKVPATAKDSVTCENGVCRLPSSNQTGLFAKGSDYLPRVANDSSGRVWMAYTSSRDLGNNICLRRLGAEGDADGAKSTRVTRTLSDDYAPDIAISQDDSIWLTWTSDKNGKYDIYVKSYSDGKWSEETRITESADDAFHPRIAASRGNVAVTYYKWNRDLGASRDRNLFVRMYVNGRWGREIEVSPAEPKYDDHTDPAIVFAGKDTVWIAWSYDYHPQLYKEPLDTDEPSIFARKINLSGEMEEPILVGTRGRKQHAIDILPSLAYSSKSGLWCAWDAALNGQRVILVSRYDEKTRAFGPETMVSDARQIASSPSITIDSDGVPYVAWIQIDGQHRSSVRYTRFSNGQWQDPPAVVADATQGAVRNPMVLAGTRSSVLVAYEQVSEKESEIAVQRIGVGRD